MPFLVIFVMIPLAELMVFASVGEEIGLFNTLLLALITAIIGGALVRRQGLQTIIAMRESSNNGQLPLNELFDGFCLVIAGATLITPGFITDTIGFLLLIPSVRRVLKSYIQNHTRFGQHNTPPEQTYSNIIEGEYENIDDEER